MISVNILMKNSLQYLREKRNKRKEGNSKNVKNKGITLPHLMINTEDLINLQSIKTFFFKNT